MPVLNGNDELDQLGERYHSYRESLLADKSIGLTKFYNRFHDQSDDDSQVELMRGLHCEIDLAVARLYGWDDIDLEHGYHEVPYLPENDRVRFSISGRARLEVLRRLSDLNRQRYEEEVAQGLHGNAVPRASTRATRAGRTASAAMIQPSLDFESGAATSVNGVTPATAILEFLSTHRGWHAKADVLAAVGITDGQWNTAIAELIAGGKVERQGERRGARYRFTSEAGE